MLREIKGGFYDLCYTVSPSESTEVCFARNLADEIVEEFQQLIGEPFTLSISERHSGSKVFAWQVHLYTAGLYQFVDLSKKNPIRLNALQRYFARNVKDPEQNYSGVIEINAIMASDNAHPLDDLQCINRIKALVRLAFAHYYERIVTDYRPEWSTDYLDAPVRRLALLQKAATAEELWRAKEL